MKKQPIIGLALAVGVLTIGVYSASAAEHQDSSCNNHQVVQQFEQHVSGLKRSLALKGTELREQYLPDSIDIYKVAALEEEIKELKGQIDAAAQKYALAPCSRS